MTEVEIRDELKDQGVVGVNRVTLKKEGKVIPTNTLFLTFGYKYRAVNIRYTFIKITNIKVTDAWENTQRRYNIVHKASVFTGQFSQISVSANSAIYNQKTLTNTKINERMAKVILTYVLRPSVLLDIVGTLKSIKRLRDGSFLVECGKRAQAQNLLRTDLLTDQSGSQFTGPSTPLGE